MATQSVPSTATISLARSQTAGEMQPRSQIIRKNVVSRGTSRAIHRSVPPIHELTTHNIGYNSNSNIIRFQKSAPTPANMTYLPSAQEKLLQSRKLLAKIIGFDAGVFEQNTKAVKHQRASSSQSIEEDLLLSSRYNNAFSPVRSPRGLRSSREYEMSHSEFLKGHGLPATPRLLRGGDSKKYGVRRQISASNQLELSPDFAPESWKSALHFNTPAGDQLSSETPADESKVVSPVKVEEKQESDHQGNLISPFDNEDIDATKIALTNSLVSRDRNRDAPWVYCYKVKKDRLKLSQLLSSKSPTDPAVNELLPAF